MRDEAGTGGRLRVPARSRTSRVMGGQSTAPRRRENRSVACEVGGAGRRRPCQGRGGVVPDGAKAPPGGRKESLNAPSGAGCSLTPTTPPTLSLPASLNAPSGAGCSLTPAPGRRVVATFPGAGSPPALRGPSGRWLEHPISTTFRWYDATRHRRPRERIRRRLWTRPCGKVAVRRGVPHHTSGDQRHKLGQLQPWFSTPRAPAPTPPPLIRSPGTNPSCATSWPSPLFWPPWPRSS